MKIKAYVRLVGCFISLLLFTHIAFGQNSESSKRSVPTKSVQTTNATEAPPRPSLLERGINSLFNHAFDNWNLSTSSDIPYQPPWDSVVTEIRLTQGQMNLYAAPSGAIQKPNNQKSKQWLKNFRDEVKAQKWSLYGREIFDPDSKDHSAVELLVVSAATTSTPLPSELSTTWHELPSLWLMYIGERMASIASTDYSLTPSGFLIGFSTQTAGFFSLTSNKELSTALSCSSFVVVAVTAVALSPRSSIGLIMQYESLAHSGFSCVMGLKEIVLDKYTFDTVPGTRYFSAFDYRSTNPFSEPHIAVPSAPSNNPTNSGITATTGSQIGLGGLSAGSFNLGLNNVSFHLNNIDLGSASSASGGGSISGLPSDPGMTLNINGMNLGTGQSNNIGGANIEYDSH